MNRDLAAMSGILLLAFALGAGGLNLDPIWADELASVSFMGAFDPPYDAAQAVTTLLDYSPDQGPLYFVLGAYWARLVGFSHFALRFLSLLPGVLMLATLYRLGADLLSRRTALLASLLLATSAFVTLYLHDIRMYTLWMWLAIAHCWLYWRLAHGIRASRRCWILFVVSVPLLLYTHFFSAILLSAIGVYHLLFARHSPRWRALILGFCAGGLMFLPYLPLVAQGIGHQASVTRNPLSALEPIPPLLLLLSNGILPLLIAPLGLGWLARHRLRRRAIGFLATVTVAVAGCILLLNAGMGFITLNRFRYFLVIWPAALLLIAFVICALPRPKRWMTLYAALWCAAGFHFHQSGAVVDYAGLMARDRGLSAAAGLCLSSARQNDRERLPSRLHRTRPAKPRYAAPYA